MSKVVGKYELKHTLGEGSFGKVKFATDTETGENVAVKILDKAKIQQQNMGAQIKKEITIMKMVTHKNIVAVKNVFATSSKIFIVLELVTGGELFEKIAKDGKLSEEKAKFYYSQILDGLEYCHSVGVCHRDLKPENLLLDADGNVKISDFGLSTLYIGDSEADGAAREELLHTTCGTPNYVAPEVLLNKGYDGRKSDVWSVGVILFVLLAGYLPFEESTMTALFTKIKSANFQYPKWFSEEVKGLLDRILTPNPSRRLSISEIKQHSWMQKKTAGASVDAEDVGTEVRIPKKAKATASRTPTADDNYTEIEDRPTDDSAFAKLCRCLTFQSAPASAAPKAKAAYKPANSESA